MFRTALQSSSRSAGSIRFNSSKPIVDKVKDAAKEFKADGKIGSKFTSKGEIGEKFDKEVGGVFSKDGAVGQNFEKDGAVGGTGQKAAEKVEQAAKESK